MRSQKCYDSIGRCVYKKVTTNGTVTLHQRYIYRGYLQIACIDLTRSNHPALWYITWDPTQTEATRPLSIQINGTWYTYGWDLTKNICELYGLSGYIATSYTYTPFGAVTATGSVSQPVQWSSECYDDTLHLVNYTFRNYNFDIGRWTQRDPLYEKSGYNLYNYNRNQPSDSVDILGMTIYHILDPNGANNFGHSMYIIGSNNKYKAYNYGPVRGKYSVSDSLLRNSSGSPTIQDIMWYRTAQEAADALKVERGWFVQGWLTTPQEDTIAIIAADEYVEDTYVLFLHNCYTLIQYVFKKINEKAGYEKYTTYGGIGPKKAFIINARRRGYNFFYITNPFVEN